MIPQQLDHRDGHSRPIPNSPSDSNPSIGYSLKLTTSPQLNIANPSTGAQKLIDIEDERKLRVR